MSIKLMTMVLDGPQEMSGAKLMIMLCLADYANDAGVCWASYPTLARRARVSSRQAMRAVDELVEEGWIAKRDRRKTRTGKYVNVYRIGVQKLQDSFTQRTASGKGEDGDQDSDDGDLVEAGDGDLLDAGETGSGTGYAAGHAAANQQASSDTLSGDKSSRDNLSRDTMSRQTPRQTPPQTSICSDTVSGDILSRDIAMSPDPHSNTSVTNVTVAGATGASHSPQESASQGDSHANDARDALDRFARAGSASVESSSSLYEGNQSQQDARDGQGGAQDIPATPAAPVKPLHLVYRDLLDELRVAKNKTGVLMRIYVLLYGEANAPSFSWLARTANKCGGAGYVARRLWELAADPPQGDIMLYLQAETDRRKQREREKTDYRGISVVKFDN